MKMKKIIVLVLILTAASCLTLFFMKKKSIENTHERAMLVIEEVSHSVVLSKMDLYTVNMEQQLNNISSLD